MDHIPYTYSHCPVPGGGYATGFLFHPRKEGLLYLRTDIGGTYRFDPGAQRWIFLCPHVNPLHQEQAYPISLAVDADRPELVYIMCGLYQSPTGRLAVSCDYGSSFTEKPVPFFVHGNLSGRGTGERLIVDAHDGDTLWYASQTEGLWVTHDQGDSWQRVKGMPETHLTFIAQVNGCLVAGSAGVATRQGDMRGPALYLGDGESFRPMEQPERVRMANCRIHGVAAQRWSADDRYLYVTFGANGPRSFIDELGYSCDSGDNVDGHIVRYPLIPGGFAPMEDITPCGAEGCLPWGYSGICASQRTPGLVVATTICKFSGDSVFLSRDHGATWQEILCGLDVGCIRFRTSYLRPEHIGGEYGFYRTLDDGKTYARLNTEKQMYGGIISLDGDCRVFGQFYLATGTYGLIYGKEQTT